MCHINKVISNYLLLPLLLILCFVITSCSQHSLQEPEAVFNTELTQTSQQYLQQAQHHTGNNKINLLLLAANASLKENNTTQADSILKQLVGLSLSPAQRQEYSLTQAMLAYRTQNIKLAQQMITQVNASQLSGVQLYHYYLIQVYLNQDNPLQQLRAYIELEKSADNTTEQHNIIDSTWGLLTQITSAEVNSFVVNADEVTLQGWLDLWQVKQNNSKDFNALQRAVANWQLRYPNNPAATYLPRTIFAPYYSLPTDNSNVKIALMLPLSGEYEALGQAILLGFEQSMLANLTAKTSIMDNSSIPVDSSEVHSTTESQATSDTTKDTSDDIASLSVQQKQEVDTLLLKQEIAQHLKIYDTNGAAMASLVQQAQSDGAQLIVGPLLSQDVSQLATMKINIPVLALSYPQQEASSNNMCYFVTSPEEEAREAAEYIYHQGKTHPLVLVPNNTLGHKIAEAFAETWQREGGETILGQFFPNKAELTKLMNSGIGISVSGTPIVLNTVSSNSTQSILSNEAVQPQSITTAATDSSATVKSENTIDSIYLAASKDQLLLLKPMLEMLSPEQRKQPEIAPKNVPQIYMSSFGHQQDEGTDFNLEMNNIIFSDIPLLTSAQESKLSTLPNYIQEDYTLVRAYALGADAWSLANNYPQLHNNPNYVLQGETGLLKTTKNCVIQRQPVWQQYNNGKIVALK